MRRILVVDDDRDVLVSVTNVVRAEFPHVEVRVAASVAGARALSDAEVFDVVLADARFRDGLPGRLITLQKPIDTERLLEILRES